MNMDPRTLAQTLKNKTETESQNSQVPLSPGSKGTCMNVKVIDGEAELRGRGSQVPDLDSTVPDISSSVSLHIIGQYSGFQLCRFE